MGVSGVDSKTTREKRKMKNPSIMLQHDSYFHISLFPLDGLKMTPHDPP